MSYIDDQEDMYQKVETLCTVSMELIYLDGQVKKQGLCVAHPNDRNVNLFDL